MLRNSVARKLVMAVTGFGMIGFVVVHLLGNTTIYAGPGGINAYGAMLHRFPLLIWPFRLAMLIMFSLHVFYGIQLKLENRAAKPQSYAITEYRQATFAGRTMIWTGLLIGAFIICHLLQFTFQVTNPGISAIRHPDALGRPDVFTMVVSSFRNVPISAAYIFAMGALGLHLMHSIQSAFQTAGLRSERTFPAIIKGGLLVATLVFLGYIMFPVAVLTGLLK